MNSSNLKKLNLLNYPIAIAILIASFALFIRIAFILFYDVHPLAGSDPTAFWSYAEGIVNGQGFRSSFEPWLADRPPLYSYFLAGIFLLGGKNQQAVFLVQALFASVASAIFYLSLLNLLDKFGSLVGGLLFAFFPPILLFTKQILTEAIYIPIWVFFLACLVFFRKRVDYKLLLGAGFFLGLLTLVRREAILPSGVLAVLLLWTSERPQAKRAFRHFVLLFGVAGLVILPWLVRNYYVLGKPALSSSSGYNFMVGNNPLANGTYAPPPADWQARFQGLSELQRDQLAWSLSLNWIQSHPVDFMLLMPKKLLALWEAAHNIILDGADILLMILSLGGLYRVVQRKDQWKFVAILSLLPVFTTILLSLVFLGGWRYRLIVYPGLFLLAGYGMMQLICWCSTLQRRFQGQIHATIP